MNGQYEYIEAHHLLLDGNRGRVYGPLDLSLGEGELLLVTGPAGSGRTSLLLTLAGRLKPSRGSQLTVLGHELPRQARAVQHRSSAVGFAGLDDLDEEVTVGATIREREAWLAPWYRVVRRPDDAHVAQVCNRVFADRPVPAARQVVHSLDETSNLMLRLSLAMLSNPSLLVVDDLDQLRDSGSRVAIWESLRRLAECDGVTVVVASATARELTSLNWPNPPRQLALAS
ncbi:MAG: ATP-binding cassette domain-containing protein [Propionicimonas sp.]|nr:ATP-binding cassette domain-containing protein [Propionicimonas sp.]